MKRIFLYLELLLISVKTINVYGQPMRHDVTSDYLFSYLTVENGLPNNFIDDIYKDHHGFIWIITYGGGLLRYDGYDFISYNINSYPSSIKSNFVKKVCEDNFHRLWIASEGGIDVINLNTMTTLEPYSKDSLFNKYKNRIVSMLHKDSHGSMFVSTQNAIEKLDFDSNGDIVKVHELRHAPTIHSAINAYSEVNGQTLAGFNNSVFRIITDGNGYLRLRTVSPLLTLRQCSFIIDMTEKENELWIGTDNGLYRYNMATRSIKAYYHNDADAHSLTQNFISNLMVTADRQLFVATLKGLNIYDPIQDDFNNVTQDAGKLNNNFVNSMLCDGNNIWIGTESGGLNKMSKRILPFINYTNAANNPTSISHGCVNAIYQDKNGDLWVGCVEGGLNYKAATGSSFRHFTTADGLSHNSVSVIISTPDGRLWLGTWGMGINIFDKSSKRVCGHLNTSAVGFDINFIGSMIYDKTNNGIWIGSNRNILFYDLSTKKMSSPLPQTVTSGINGSLGVIITKDNTLLMGTTKGVIRISLNSFRHNRKHFLYNILTPDKERRSTAFLNKTTCFTQSHDGTLWIGSNGYGLIKVSKGRYTLFSTRNGLCNDVITQIIDDGKHHLWIATANGLSCFNINTGRFANYYKQDGIVNNQFFWNGGFKLQGNGKIYLGNTNGLVEIDADHISTLRHINNVTLTNISIGGNRIYPGNGGYLTEDISQAKIIKLHESDRYISIEFSSLDYDSPSSVVYQYRLKGFDDSWTTVSSDRRFATFTNLPSGTYKFQVRCSTGLESFSDRYTEITIEVKPYFYKTWWFMLISVFIISFAVWRGMKWRIKSLNRQKAILQAKVEQRTADLAQRTKELSTRNELLSQQNVKINRQKTQLEQMARKVQELTMDKLAFFTNITHEFRTPVTLIIGPIERALKLSTNPKVIEQLQFVEHSSKHLLTLINQLMDFRKVETGNLNISLEPNNIMTFIDDIILPFNAFAKETGITVRVVSRISDPHIMFDKEAMNKIFTNLLGNAIKYTDKGGKITIYIASLGKQLYISVSDTGKGLVEADIEKIFNQFYQSHNGVTKPGTGIGLYLCKRLVTLLGGTITANNNHSKGASFRILLPLKRFEPSANKPSVEQTVNAIDGDAEETETEKMTILVVEDNKDMREYIRSILIDTYSVVTAENGIMALNKLKDNSVDFIISDLMMPEMDGLQLERSVKNDFATSHIPFLMLTAKTARESQLEGLKYGADDYIMKPFDEDMLKARIASILDNRRRCHIRFKTDMVVDDLNIDNDSSDKKFIDMAMRIVKENYQNSYYEVSDFIEAMGVSKSLLNKKMQTLTGQSAGQFIRNYRLNIAHSIIIKNRQTHNSNISDIAYMVGFNDPKYFTRCFTKQFGTPPSAMMEE